MCKNIYGYVYMVRNKINNKLYFGITENDFDTRYSGNIAKYTHNEHLQNSIKKYGIENFEINEQFDVAYNEDDLYDLEDMYICLYNTLNRKHGYNKRRSGSKHKGSGKLSEESRNKMSKTRIERGLGKGANNGMYGVHRYGEDAPNYGNGDKIRGEKNPFYGKHHTEESKKKMSEAHKGIKATDDTKQKLSEIRKGGKNPKAHAVICLETKQVFSTIKEGKEWLGRGNIRGCCRGRLKTAGGYHWMYYEDYLKLNDTEEIDSVTDVA